MPAICFVESRNRPLQVPVPGISPAMNMCKLKGFLDFDRLVLNFIADDRSGMYMENVEFVSLPYTLDYALLSS
jgi:hypothetical protein